MQTHREMLSISHKFGELEWKAGRRQGRRWAQTCECSSPQSLPLRALTWWTPILMPPYDTTHSPYRREPAPSRSIKERCSQEWHSGQGSGDPEEPSVCKLGWMLMGSSPSHCCPVLVHPLAFLEKKLSGDFIWNLQLETWTVNLVSLKTLKVSQCAAAGPHPNSPASTPVALASLWPHRASCHCCSSLTPSPVPHATLSSDIISLSPPQQKRLF